MSKKKEQLSDDQVDSILKEASLLAGFPIDAKAVAKSEAEELPPLPSHLLDPEAVFRRNQTPTTRLAVNKECDADVPEQLRALAARNGTELSEATRKLMDDDRAAAQSNANENDVD